MFAPYDNRGYAVVPPVDWVDNVPAAVRTRHYGRYELALVDDMVVLCQKYPVTGPEPTAAAVSEDARALVFYARGTFGAADAVASAAVPTTPPSRPVEEAFDSTD